MTNAKHRPVDTAIEDQISLPDDHVTPHETMDEAAEKPEPSWFPPARILSAKEMAERYRAMRPNITSSFPAQTNPPKPAIRFRPSQPLRGASVPMPIEVRSFQTLHDDPAYRTSQDDVEAAQDEFEETPHRPALMPVYIIAGLLAMLAGGSIGYGAAHFSDFTSDEPEVAVIESPRPVMAAAAAAAPLDVIPTPKTTETKPIVTASLDVQDASGALNSMIPLALQAEPADQANIILKLSGLPPSAYLTVGRKTGTDGWELSAAEAREAKLVVPQSPAPQLSLSVSAVEAGNGQLATPVREFTVALTDPSLRISPAAAPPETAMVKESAQPIPQPQQNVTMAETPAEAANLAAKGDILLKAGDLEMARQFYERAFAQGSAEAAIGVGRTYDPVVYRELKVQGIQPDPARAMEWYNKASMAGAHEAEAAIANLKALEP